MTEPIDDVIPDDEPEPWDPDDLPSTLDPGVVTDPKEER